MSYCHQCGQYHETAVCPNQIPIETTAVPQPDMVPGRVTFGGATLNGLSFGEQAIIDKLDEIIKLIRTKF